MATRALPSGTRFPQPTDPASQYGVGGYAPVPPQMGVQAPATGTGTMPAVQPGAQTQSVTGGLPGGYSTQGGTLAGFSAPGVLAPFTQGHDLDPRRISESPAYQFRLGQGTEAINRRAAADGTLLTGGTLKDLATFGQGLASQEYDNEWQRGFAQQGQNANIWDQNAARTLGGLSSVSGMGLAGAGGQADALTGAGNALAGGTRGSASAMNAGVGMAANTLGELFARRRAQPQVPNPSGSILY